MCFMQFHVQIPGSLADLRVDRLIDAQKLGIAQLPFETYDGVAWVQGVFDGKHVRGNAWNEQNLNLYKSDG